MASGARCQSKTKFRFIECAQAQLKRWEDKMIDKNKIYVTRFNENVELFSVNEPTDSKPAAVDGVITHKDGAKESHYWNSDGSSFVGCDEMDLIEVGVEHTKTVFLMLSDDGFVTVVDSLADAVEWNTKILALKKMVVTFKNGEGL